MAITQRFIHRVGLLLAIVWTAQSCKTIRPPAPVMADKSIPAPSQPKSEINIPVSLELKNYFRQAEAEVPEEYTGKEAPCEGLRYDYLFKRSPFDIKGSGNRIDLSFQGKYKIRMDYCAKCAFDQCIVPLVSVSCGYGEPLRKINIGYSSTFSVLPDYHLRSKTTLSKLEPVDRCKLTVLSIDATDKLIGYVRGPLNDLGAEVDKEVSTLDLKPYVTDLWNQLNSEFHFGSFGYLAVNPKSVALSTLNITGSQVNFNLALTANPVLRSKSAPPPPQPLPNLSTYAAGSGFHICLDLMVSYDSLSKFLSDEVKGMVIPIKRKKFIIKGVDVYGIGNEKIVIGIEFGGSRRGKVYLLGTPVYNPLTGKLSFPDLQFDIQTKNVLYKMARWLFNDKITKMIRTEAVYDFTPLLEETRVSLEKELSKDFGSGILTSGKISDLGLQAIFPVREHVILRVISNGSLKVEIKE